MYLKVKNNAYTFLRWNAKQNGHIFVGVPEELILPLNHSIEVCTHIPDARGANKEFVLNVIDGSTFPYQSLEDGVLILLKTAPEPAPEPEPKPEPAPDPLTDIKLAIAELAEAQAADMLNVQLAIAELAEALLGGE